MGKYMLTWRVPTKFSLSLTTIIVIFIISHYLFKICYPKPQSCRHFSALPRKIHDRICHLLPVKNTGLSQVLDSQISCLYITRHTQAVQRGPSWFSSANQVALLLPRLHSIGSAAILRTRRRVAEEGCGGVARAPPIASRPTLFIELSCQKQIG
jgi:hypothetical protein